MEQQNSERVYINDEICTYMTNNKLLAFKDRLNPASSTNYACIHAKGEDGADGRRVYSTIGILASDFSKGKGENNIKTEANISPAEARYVFHLVEQGLGVFDGIIFSSEKIFGKADPQGYSQVRKLVIGRASMDNEKKPRKSPWYVIVENGVGIKASNANGGTYCKKDSYKCERKVFVYFTDMDFYCYLSQVVAFINTWEVTFGSKVIREGRAAFEAVKAEYAAEKANTPQNQEAPPPQAAQPPPSPQSSQTPPPQGDTKMTLEDARAVLISVGKHSGKTLGQLEKEWPAGLNWYFTAYHGNDERLRAGASVIASSLQKAS
jgi:hypothetical protein